MTWQVDFAQAVRGNEGLVAQALPNGRWSTSDVDERVRQVIVRGEHMVRSQVRYEFHGEEHAIVSWSRCIQRGYAACADATAVLVVLAACAGARRIALCLEEERTNPVYAHVRMVCDGYIADAYRDRRIDVDECRYLVDIDDVMGRGWHARVVALGERMRRG